MIRIFGLAFAAAALLAAGPAGAAEEAPRAITVVGEGLAFATPDVAIVTGGVVTRDKTAGGALKANAAAMTKVLAAVRQAGVADRDVGTAGLGVQPRYDDDESGSGRAAKLAGYEARNLVTIRSRTIDRFGELVDALVGAGANQIENLAFDVEERERILDQARRSAVADARRKAELLAAAAGAKLGPVMSIDEDAGYSEPAQPYARNMKAMDAAASTPIAKGELELRARVTVRWGLEPK